MDRLLARRLKLQEQENVQAVKDLGLPELKMEIDRIDSDMVLERNIVFKKTNTDEVRTASMHKIGSYEHSI